MNLIIKDSGKWTRDTQFEENKRSIYLKINVINVIKQAFYISVRCSLSYLKRTASTFSIKISESQTISQITISNMKRNIYTKKTDIRISIAANAWIASYLWHAEWPKYMP